MGKSSWVGETLGLRLPPFWLAVVMDSEEVAVVVPWLWPGSSHRQQSTAQLSTYEHVCRVEYVQPKIAPTYPHRCRCWRQGHSFCGW